MSRAPPIGSVDMTIEVSVATFWCTTTLPGGAPISVPRRSATARTSGSQSLLQASTPLVSHRRAKVASESGTVAGIAPSELLIRYVHRAVVGKRVRQAVTSASVRGAAAAELMEPQDRTWRRDSAEASCDVVLGAGVLRVLEDVLGQVVLDEPAEAMIVGV